MCVKLGRNTEKQTEKEGEEWCLLSCLYGEQGTFIYCISQKCICQNVRFFRYGPTIPRQQLSLRSRMDIESDVWMGQNVFKKIHMDTVVNCWNCLYGQLSDYHGDMLSRSMIKGNVCVGECVKEERKDGCGGSFREGRKPAERRCTLTVWQILLGCVSVIHFLYLQSSHRHATPGNAREFWNDFF